MVAVLTLALGIGLCSLVFSILNTYVLRPLPAVSEPGRLATIQTPVTYPYFERYRDQSGLASATAAFIGPVPFSVWVDIRGSTQPERVFGQLVSPEYFSTLGVEPLLGRFFNPAFENLGAAPTAIVTERFWRTHLHAAENFSSCAAHYSPSSRKARRFGLS